MSQSPRGISPTEKRVDYLMQAKTKRLQRNHVRRNTMDGSNPFQNDEFSSAISRRRMTGEMTGAIGVPTDFKPKDIIKRKNDSLFTNSLLAGDAPGYAFIEGGPRTTRHSGQ